MPTSCLKINKECIFASTWFPQTDSRHPRSVFTQSNSPTDRGDATMLSCSKLDLIYLSDKMQKKKKDPEPRMVNK